MGLDGREVETDPWKFMWERVSHCQVSRRGPRAYHCQEWGVTSSSINPAGAYGKDAVGAAMLEGTPWCCHGRLPRPTATEERQAWRGTKDTTSTSPCFHDYQRKDTIWPKAELPDEVAHGASLQPAPPRGWNPKRDMFHCNNFNFPLLTSTGPQRINRMPNLRKTWFSCLHCSSRKLP